MIGYITGKIIYSDGKQAIVLTKSGIGHEVNLAKMVVEGDEVELFISHIFRENDQELYAFINYSEKKIFETLLKVKGVGAKSAYSIIKHLGPAQTIRSIKLEDKTSLQSVPGIGPKAAAQIVLDLKGKVDQLVFNIPEEISWRETPIAKDEDHSGGTKKTKVSKEVKTRPNENKVDVDTFIRETLLACRELGFKDFQVTTVIREVLAEEEIQSTEILMQRVLKNLASQVR